MAESDLIQSHPEIANYKQYSQGVCGYQGPFSHINVLLRLSRLPATPTVIYSPDKCQVVPPNKKLVLFAIRSVEANFRNRETIRHTWLDSSQWKFADDLIIHPIFLVTKSPGTYPAIDYETNELRDILQIDVLETSYISYMIEIAFLNYVRKSCSNVSYVFRGNDNTMGMGYIINNINVKLSLRINTGYIVHSYKSRSSQPCINPENFKTRKPNCWMRSER